MEETNGTQRRDERMEERYRAGASIHALAREVGMTAEGVRQVLIKRGVTMRKRGPEPKTRTRTPAKAARVTRRKERQGVLENGTIRRRVIEERRTGKGIYAIAEAVGVLPETVVAILHRVRPEDVAAVLDS